MKIQGSHPLFRLESVNGSRNNAQVKRGQTGTGADSVRLSGEALWLQDLKEAIESIPQVRVDEVARARQDIATGELGSEADLENTVNALLHEI
jgi:anti-sigma28 factor (negative regulator of flagellin synthesis)